ncbi:hypothetical protein [Streptomyces sp. NPDC053431]|uniref:hypothetical protein n=1 Tax=Streptomyces sp. NPDC053431 TaxID=3365703 RepID=UPI0037CFA7D5
MYEMHVGAAAPGSGLVWHIVAPGDGTTLCGQALNREGPADTDLHCTPCMVRFQSLIEHSTQR